jgi:hypothetical protein
MSSSARGAGRRSASFAPIVRRSSPSGLPRVRSAGPSSPSSARAARLACLKGPSAAPVAAWISQGAARCAGRSCRRKRTPAQPADRPCAQSVDPPWRRTPAPARSAGPPSRMCAKPVGRSWNRKRPAARVVDIRCSRRPEPHVTDRLDDPARSHPGGPGSSILHTVPTGNAGSREAMTTA